MSSDGLFVGIDVGTTGARCMIFDSSGRCVGSGYREYGLNRPRPGWVEQSVGEILAATEQACRQATSSPGVEPGAILSVGVSNQCCVTCPADASGNLLRELISWQDFRAGAQAAYVAERIDPERFRSITGTTISPQNILSKILWLREHEPHVFDRARWWLQLQHIVLRHLGADGYLVDMSQAGFFGVWDVAKREFSEELLSFAGIDGGAFGEIVEAGTRVGRINARASEATGIPAGVALCVGAGDAACGLVGMNSVKVGDVSIILGTAGAFSMTVDAARVDLGEFMLLNHVVPHLWSAGGITLAAASAYRWFRDVFGQPETAADGAEGGNAFERLNVLCGLAPPGSDGLLFLPYLNSAGTPRWNPDACGAFLGITPDHDRAHFARAVMEGVALEVQDILVQLRRHDLAIARIRVGGGAVRSALWNQIQANVYGSSIELLAEGETSALGAAILGGVGAGVFGSLDEGIAAMVRVSATIDPQPAQLPLYRELYETFVAAYDGLTPAVFPRLAALRAR